MFNLREEQEQRLKVEAGDIGTGLSEQGQKAAVGEMRAVTRC